MPTTWNGIGTAYWGKRNGHQRVGACGQCGKVGSLSSFETRHYAVVLGLPVFPLRECQVIDQCPACTAHVAVPLVDFKKKTLAELVEYLRVVRENPGDAEALRNALGLAAGTWNRPAFASLSAQARAVYPNDPTLWAIMGDGHHLLGEADAAIEAYRAAVRLDGTEEHIPRLAFLLLSSGRREEAQALLCQPGYTAPGNLLGLLIEEHLLAKDVDSARQVVDVWAKVEPDVASTREFKRLRARIEKGGKPRNPLSRLAVEAKTSPTYDFAGRVAPLLLPLILLVAGLGHAGTSWHAKNHVPVHLVSGSLVPYTVRIQGREFHLQPGSVQEIELAEGLWQVEPVGDAPGVEPWQREVRREFLSRPFDPTERVLNPDRTALLVRSLVFYGKMGGDPDERVQGLAEPYQEFKRIDYLLRPPPNSVSISSSSTYESKIQIQLLPPEQFAPEALEDLEAQFGATSTAEFALRRAWQQPLNPKWLKAWLAGQPAEKRRDGLRAGLEHRPVLIPWHREYQDAERASGRTAEIQAEYRRWSDADPGNPALRYLNLRVDDTVGHEAFVQLEVSSTGPIGYGWMSAARILQDLGRMEEALGWARKAHEVQPENPLFTEVHLTCAEAAGDFETALRLAGLRLRGPGHRLKENLEFVRLLHAAGKHGDADAHVVRWMGALGKSEGPAAVAAIRPLLDRESAYWRGDLASFQALSKDSGDPDLVIAGRLSVEPAAACFKAMEEEPEPWAGVVPFLLYLVAVRDGEPALAERAWRNGIASLKTLPDPRLAELPAWMEGGTEVDARALEQINLEPAFKSLLLAGFGHVHPAHREWAHARARALNFKNSFPHRLIRDCLGTQPKPTS